MRFVKGETNFFFVGPVFLENVPVPSAALQADLIEVVHPAPSAHLTFCSARLCHFSLSGLDKPPAHPYNDMCLFGVWRSLVSRLVRVQEAPGSNPGTPTIGVSFGILRFFALLHRNMQFSLFGSLYVEGLIPYYDTGGSI